MKKLFGYTMIMVLLFSCKQEPSDILGDLDPPVLARFSLFIEEDSIVHFTNLSVNANAYIWEFGDGQSSNEESPVHRFSNGYYTVTLSASNELASNQFVQSVDIVTQQIDFTPPPVDTFKVIQSKWEFLSGGPGMSKTWVLANELNAISFGPKEDLNTRWWGMGQGDLNDRTCLLDNEYIFSYDSLFSRDTNGSIWKEFNMFSQVGCMPNGGYESTLKSTTVDSWGDGNFNYRMSISGDSTIIQTFGEGAYIGHYVMGVDDSSWEPAMEYTYLITSISEDTLKIQSYGFAGDSPIDGYTSDEADRYWKATLVRKQ